ncbi:cysteine desulfurase family protein [Candidatus Odyssella thessalonicensis]|uniref:cysteine desulfurase family protein n=1 Tax=Candidatus Odyssella thessalonicensis TaxID=84647 RepID=UPI000225C1EB|nr:cysteine desulfurase family protein [Candidatus Odyssella thessalonicensis]
MQRVYLDYNASAPIHPIAQAAVVEALRTVGNASSIHTHGRAVRSLLEEARFKVAEFFTVKPAQVIFTSGATEANNLIIKGFSGQVITSAIEHDSILEADKAAFRCAVDGHGRVDLLQLEELLKQSGGSTLVSIMAANNETGVVQPLADIITLARQYGAQVHCDAVQAIGKLPLDWKELKPDFISISGHKIGALQGIGALIINEHIPLTPLIRGGGQERYFRSGTENSLGIISLGAVIENCKTQHWVAIQKLRDTLEQRLTTLCPELKIFGSPAERLPNTSCFATPGMASNTQVMHFDLMGISVSAGSACSSGKVKVSHVLKAMNVPAPSLQQSLRVSLGHSTTEREIDHFIKVWQDLYDRTHSNLKERIGA